MDARFGDFKRTQLGGLLAALNVALKAKAQNHQPIGLAACAAFFDGFVDRHLADCAELGAEVEVSLTFAARRLIETFGVQVFVRQQFDARENHLFVFASVLDAGRKQMLF